MSVRLNDTVILFFGDNPGLIPAPGLGSPHVEELKGERRESLSAASWGKTGEGERAYPIKHGGETTSRQPSRGSDKEDDVSFPL